MRYRQFPRFDWQISEIGYGMWGMAGWTGSDDEESSASLDRAVALGCTFFDTAWAYGRGHSEQLLGALVRRHPDKPLIVATKVPPMNGVWPGSGNVPARDVFPYDHVVGFTQASLKNLRLDSLDLQQLHVWSDAWAADDGWKRAVDDLKRRGLIRAFGISVNRWEPENVLKALETGLVDVVQVVYNIFDQAPEDALFPACERLGVGIIARVPFDEGSLTGTLTPSTRWPEGDFRNLYFAPPRLEDTLERVRPLQDLVTEWKALLPDVALRFILAHPAVTTTIPGMRKSRHVDLNLSTSDAPRLTPDEVQQLRAFRWNRPEADRKLS